ncbi:MAG: hypothetical protein ABI672_02705 [Vicinamibacteria bacterium]
MSEIPIGAAGRTDALAVLSAQPFHGLGEKNLFTNRGAQIEDVAMVEGHNKVAVLKLGPFIVVVLRHEFGLGKEEEIKFLIDGQRRLGQAARTRPGRVDVEMSPDVQTARIRFFYMGFEATVAGHRQLRGVDGEDFPAHDLIDVQSLEGDL